jgi:hypothetical protein
MSDSTELTTLRAENAELKAALAAATAAAAAATLAAAAAAAAPSPSTDRCLIKYADASVQTMADRSLIRTYRFCYAILIYRGTRYYGMQVQPNQAARKTIESELFNALWRADAIKADHKSQPAAIWYARASRTDKGVHALGNVVNFKSTLLENDKDNKELVAAINKHLPADVRMLCLNRCIKSFSARSFCSSRQYEYVIPSYALMPLAEWVAATATTSFPQEALNMPQRARADVGGGGAAAAGGGGGGGGGGGNDDAAGPDWVNGDDMTRPSKLHKGGGR